MGPILYRSNRSKCKAWGLLFTCMSTRCFHVEIVTGLDLNNFLLAFTRFINLRDSVDTIYSDNGSTFCAAAEALPKLLDSSEFVNSVRKRGINWIRISPYAPIQGGSWEIIVKLFKTTSRRIIGHARRKPTLIELKYKPLCPTQLESLTIAHLLHLAINLMIFYLLLVLAF